MPHSASNSTKHLIASGIQKNRRQIWEWHCKQSKLAPPPFYSSIDLRDSGYKIVPVDSNLFPAGFNNICPEDLRTAPAKFRAQVETTASRLGIGEVKRILIIPESHTTNLYYIENLYYLTQIIHEAGYEHRVGWYGDSTSGNDLVSLTSQTGKKLEAHPLSVTDGTLRAGDFVPELVLLNNDFSSGHPKILDNLKQPVLPSHKLGWHSRKKSDHFRHYNELAAEFAAIIGVDPWILQIDTEEVSPVHLGEDDGIERVAEAVDRVIQRTAEAYKRHAIDQKPFVFVKNNSGTYGMGIMVVHDGDEVRTMNRREKNKMSVGKNKSAIESVAVQEGVPTTTIIDRLPAEPVVYLVGGELIGGFLRTNTERGAEENLNSQGMVFRKLCMSDLRNLDPDAAADDLTEEELAGEEPMLELVYGAVARISALAAGRELAAALKLG